MALLFDKAHIQPLQIQLLFSYHRSSRFIIINDDKNAFGVNTKSACSEPLSMDHGINRERSERLYAVKAIDSIGERKVHSAPSRVVTVQY